MIVITSLDENLYHTTTLQMVCDMTLIKLRLKTFSEYSSVLEHQISFLKQTEGWTEIK